MKKVILLAVIALCGTTAFAQKGNNVSNSSDMYVGGGITFQSISGETSETVIIFNPEIGYKMSDKWGLGISLGYSENGSGDSKNTFFSLKPYVRQNVLEWGQIGLILDYLLFYESEGPKNGKTNAFGVGIEPGLALNLNSKISVVTHLGFLGYRSEKPDVEGAKSTSIFTIDAMSNNISLSLYYNF